MVERHGGTVVGVDELARVDAAALRDTLEEALTGRAERVGVVSIMAVNNEVGTINDLAALAPLVRSIAPDAVFHTDAVQAAGWLDLRQIWPHVDVLTLSAHKFGGPKGVGIAVMRTGVDVDPLIVGGGQERDRRSGTHNVGGIVATAAAMAEADAEREVENTRRTCSSRASTTNCCSTCSIRTECARRRRRPAPAAPRSARTCSTRWASIANGRVVPCG